MDPTWSTLSDILILLAAALLLGTLAEELRQSAILGYLLAGSLVGPNVLGLVKSDDNVAVIAELGVALLMFTIGLDFSFAKLRSMGRVAIVGGSWQVLLTILVFGLVTWLCGYNLSVAFAVGSMVAMTSTSSVLRVLVDRAELDSVHGRNAVGISLLQDVSMILLMLLLAGLSGGDAARPTSFGSFLRNALIAICVIALILGITSLVTPRLMSLRRWASNREFPILLAVVMAIGSALAAQRVGLSSSMGAFIAGTLLGGSPFARQVRADVGPLKTVFITLFFASIGMFGEPQWVMENWLTVAWVVIAVVAGKSVIMWGILRAMGWPVGIALATGMCIAPLGEFTFVLAETARGRIIDEDVFKLMISTTILTLFLTPNIIASATRLGPWIQARANRHWRNAAAAQEPEQEQDAAERDAPAANRGRILVVGYGPAGQSVVHALVPAYRESILVIDLNPRNVSAARQENVDAMIGDASNRELLEHLGVFRARVIVVTIPDPTTTRDVIHHCRHLAPDAALIVRARYNIHRWSLQQAGAQIVIDEEEEVGMRLAFAAREVLGPPPAAS